MSSQTIRHPIFARVYHRLIPAMERELAAHRRELLAGLSGRVLEIGAGNGVNFRHYPTTVEEVVALEPEPYLRSRAQEAARDAAVRVVVCEGVAEKLPPELGSFDAAVCCLVLCSVPDQDRALGELRRVVAPAGQLRFLEHVRAGSPRRARVQKAVDRSGLWSLAAGGCHCARDTVAAIRSAGFAIEQISELQLGSARLHTNPHVLGIARPGTRASRA